MQKNNLCFTQTLIAIIMSSMVVAPAVASFSLYQSYKQAADKARTQGNLGESERLYREALKLSEQGDDPIAESNFEVVSFELAKVLQRQNKLDEAENALNKIFSTKHHQVYERSRLYRYLAELLIDNQKYAAAEKALQTASSAETDYEKKRKKTYEEQIDLSVMNAICASAAGRKSELDRLLKSIVDMKAFETGTRKNVNSSDLEAVTAYLFESDRSRESTILLSKYMLDSNAKKKGWQSPETVKAALRYADLIRYSIAPGSAQALIDKCLASNPAEKEKLQLLQWKVGHRSEKGSNTSDDIKSLREAVQLSEKSKGLTNEATNQLRYKLLDAFKKAGQKDEREKFMLQTVAAVEKAKGRDSTDVADTLLTLAYFCYDGMPQKSTPVLARAISIFEKSKKPMQAMQVTDMLVAQAKNYQATKNFDESDKLFKRAIAVWEKAKYEQPLLMILPDYEKCLKDAGKQKEMVAVQNRYESIYNKHKDACGMVAFGGSTEVTEW